MATVGISSVRVTLHKFSGRRTVSREQVREWIDALIWLTEHSNVDSYKLEEFHDGIVLEGWLEVDFTRD